METKKLYAMYFSGTGTTKKTVTFIAENLSAQLALPLQIFDFTLPQARSYTKCFSKEDIVVFGVPVIAGRVPNVLLNYLDTIQGNGALVVPVVLYGNRNYDDALIELCDLLKKDGFFPISAAAFIGEHTFSHSLAKGRPDSEDLKIASDFADLTAEKIRNFNPKLPNASDVYVKGEVPYRPYYQPRDSHGKPIDIRKVKPITGNNCIDCKLCAQLCPMGSISFDNVREFSGICMKCGACIKNCPTQAKYYEDSNFLYHQRELELQCTQRLLPELFF